MAMAGLIQQQTKQGRQRNCPASTSCRFLDSFFRSQDFHQQRKPN